MNLKALLLELQFLLDEINTKVSATSTCNDLRFRLAEIEFDLECLEIHLVKTYQYISSLDKNPVQLDYRYIDLFNRALSYSKEIKGFILEKGNTSNKIGTPHFKC